jgi:hypothetical protein
VFAGTRTTRVFRAIWESLKLLTLIDLPKAIRSLPVVFLLFDISSKDAAIRSSTTIITKIRILYFLHGKNNSEILVIGLFDLELIVHSGNRTTVKIIYRTFKGANEKGFSSIVACRDLKNGKAKQVNFNKEITFERRQQRRSHGSIG